MYDRIVLPTDGSDHALQAAEHALRVAEAFESDVHVLYVLDIRQAGGPIDAGSVREQFLEELEETGAKAIRAVESLADDRDLGEIQTTIRRGHPEETIPEFASEQEADLLAMGTHGRTGISRYVLGSVTEDVLRQAEVPVLTARAGEDETADGYGDLLIPTDGSEDATLAVDHGIEIGRRFDSRIHALNVVDVSTAGGHDAMLPSSVLEDFEAAGESAAAEISASAERADLASIAEVRLGTPASGILDYAEENDVDLIAMATAGRTGPSRFLLGSTTERVVRHADVPVLAVPTTGGD
jgi:nucleotide-binding universal stress UspA family protein